MIEILQGTVYLDKAAPEAGGGGGGDSAIKDYEAPSYTINTTLFSSPLPIPNLDALTEAGTYRVHFNMDVGEGTTTTVTYIADVAPVKVSDTLFAYMQNLYVGPGGGDSVSIVRSGALDGGSITWADWSGNSVADISTKLSKKLENTATGTNSLNILGRMYNNTNYSVAIKGGAYGNYSVSVGNGSTSFANDAVAIGNGSNTHYCVGATAIGSAAAVEDNCEQGIAIGRGVAVNAKNAIQIGNTGAAVIYNNNAKTLQIWEHQLLDGNTGLIPAARLGTGFDASKTQVLKNVQGVLTWVDEA